MILCMWGRGGVMMAADKQQIKRAPVGQSCVVKLRGAGSDRGEGAAAWLPHTLL